MPPVITQRLREDVEILKRVTGFFASMPKS